MKSDENYQDLAIEFLLEKDDRAQRTLALQYNDDIPVLIRSSHKDHPGLFYGCVARGRYIIIT